MHFLLVLLRTLLDWATSAWRDGLTLAARADGRIQPVRARFDWSNRWLVRMKWRALRRTHGRLPVCAGDATTAGPDTTKLL